MKNAQAPSQVFFYILALVIVSLVFIFGYKAISGVNEKTEQTALIQFQTQLKNAVDTTISYGDERYLSLSVPGDNLKVCFIGKDAVFGDSTDAIISGHIEDGLHLEPGMQNVFMYKTQAVPPAISIGAIDIDGGVLCAEVIGGEIEIKLVGSGTYTKISLVS